MQPMSAVSPQKLGSHAEQSGPATLGRQSHVPSTGWQRLLLDPVELHEQSEKDRTESIKYHDCSTIYSQMLFM